MNNDLWIWDHVQEERHILLRHESGYPIPACGKNLQALPRNWCTDPVVCRDNEYQDEFGDHRFRHRIRRCRACVEAKA